jgi:hypothetical protein
MSNSILSSAARVLWAAAVVYSEVQAAESGIEFVEVTTPVQNRISLATTVAGMSGEQLHQVALSVSNGYGTYNISYTYVSRYFTTRDVPLYRKVILDAIASCPDEALVNLAVLIAGNIVKEA